MKVFYFALSTLIGLGVCAGEQDTLQQELTFGAPQITVEELDDIPQQYQSLKLPDTVLPTPPTQPGKPVSGEISLDKIIVIGKALWDFVKENKAQVDITKNVAHAVPEGITQWNQLAAWGKPRNFAYTIAYDNLYGVRVVNLKYYVLYTPSGSYDGKGRYLANVTVLPGEMTAAWGYTVNAQTNIHRALNVGTQENPIANVLMDISWSVSTVMKKSIETLAFSISGDGEFQELGLQ